MAGYFRLGQWSRICVPLLLAIVPCNALSQANAIDGRQLFIDPRKGNCATCHPIDVNTRISEKLKVGPDLAGIKMRLPDRAQLRAAIWDMSDKNPNTIMPPYGKHRILTEAEIDAVVRYLENR